jgi:hypothetical protein
MYYDLSGQWDQYRLHRPKNASSKAITSNDKSTILRNYLDGYQNFLKDLFLLFIPFMTFCYYYRYEEITGTFWDRACSDFDSMFCHLVYMANLLALLLMLYFPILKIPRTRTSKAS